MGQTEQNHLGYGLNTECVKTEKPHGLRYSKIRGYMGKFKKNLSYKKYRTHLLFNTLKSKRY